MKKNTLSIIIIISAVVLLFTALFGALSFHESTEKRLSQNAYTKLDNATTGEKLLFNSIIEEQYDILDLITVAVAAEPNREKIKTNLGEMIMPSSFKRVTIVFSDGVAFSNDGMTVNAEILNEAKKQKERKITNLDADTLLISQPIISNDGNVGTLLCEFDKSIFVDGFASSAFDLSSYALITDKSGNVIISTNHKAYLGDKNNIVTSLSDVEFLDGGSIEEFERDLSENRAGKIMYGYNGEDRYAVYTPLGINDWYIYTAVPASVIRNEISQAIQAGTITIIVVTLVAFVLFFIVISQEHRITVRGERARKNVEESNERLYLAMRYMTANIWDYDIKTHEIIQVDDSLQRSDFKKVVSNVPECFIKAGQIHPDSIDEIRKVYRLLSEGEERVECLLRVKPQIDGPWRYEQIQYTTLFDKNGRPYRAIGIGQDVTDKQELITAAQTDSLTGLLNHKATIEKISQVLQSGAKSDISALFIIDLDYFKNINDKLGHQTGDETLVKMAKILKECFRFNDTIGRIGGDEYMAFLSNVASVQIIERKAKQLVSMLQLHCGGMTEGILVSASIGVAICKGGDNFDDVYKRADMALYIAKENGKCQYSIDDGSGAKVINADGSAADGNSANDTLTPIQLQALLEYMDGGVMLIELTEPVSFMYLSPSFYKFSGLNPSGNYTSEDILSMIEEQDLKELLSLLREGAKTNMPIDFSYRVVTIDGAPAWRHIRAVRIKNTAHKNPVMIAVVTDLTEVKKTTATLDAIVEYSPLGIGVFDLSKGFKPVFVNQPLLAMTHFEREDFFRRAGNNAMSMVDKDSLPVIQKLIEEIKHNNKPCEAVYRTAPRTEIEQRYIRANGMRIPSFNGEDLLLVMFNDVTDTMNGTPDAK